jgi:poly(3-hydroxybutyrate) depolymerase
LIHSRAAARRLIAACLLASSLASGACARQSGASKSAHSDAGQPAANQATAGAVLRDVPEKIDANAKYLFYLHGRIVEVQGVRPRSEQHGFYEYEEILRALAARGFHVISEPRPADTEHVEYARKVVAQIGRLLAAGVPARNVTVVGASKGGAIAVYVSTLLKNRDANFVVLAGCGGETARRLKVDLYGRVLSMYDTKDEYGGDGGRGVSCSKFYKQSTGLKESNEIEVKLGVGHGLLYKPFKEWVDPAAEWANGR